MKSILLKLIILTLWLTICIFASYMIVKDVMYKKLSKLTKVWLISTISILFAIPISFYGILQHLIFYTKPFLQLYIIRILWMVPIYTINAWIALRFPQSAIYLDTLRECYEAYVIYNFMTFLLNYLKCSLDLIATLEEKRSVSHIFPASLVLPRWKSGWHFVHNCKRGVLQYTVIRPLMTIVALLTETFGVYHDGVFSFRYAWIYTILINNVSQIFAMYCLILFYKATYQELRPMKPLGKFFCVKAVVFASFWQSVLIAFLVHSKILTEANTWSTHDTQSLQSSLQNFCICIEMLFAAIAHFFCFPVTPYIVNHNSLQDGSIYNCVETTPSPVSNLDLTSATVNNCTENGGKCDMISSANYNDENLVTFSGMSTFPPSLMPPSSPVAGKSCGVKDQAGDADDPEPDTVISSVWKSLKVMFNVSDVYEDMHQQVNYMIKSNALRSRYRESANPTVASTLNPSSNYGNNGNYLNKNKPLSAKNDNPTFLHNNNNKNNGKNDMNKINYLNTTTGSPVKSSTASTLLTFADNFIATTNANNPEEPDNLVLDECVPKNNLTAHQSKSTSNNNNIELLKDVIGKTY